MNFSYGDSIADCMKKLNKSIISVRWGYIILALGLLVNTITLITLLLKLGRLGVLNGQ